MNEYFGAHAIVAIESTDSFLTLKTFDARHGNSMRMYVFSDKLYHWLDSEAQDNFLDHDCGSFMIMRRIDKEQVSVQLTWLHALSNGEVKGYKQSFTLPVDNLMAVLITGDRVRKLVSLDERSRQASITITNGAHRQIHQLDKRQRRALSKALRDSFYWKDSSLCLYADWGNDFAFVDQRMNGGLCLHESRVVGKNGRMHSKLRYQVHT